MNKDKSFLLAVYDVIILIVSPKVWFQDDNYDEDKRSSYRLWIMVILLLVGLTWKFLL